VEARRAQAETLRAEVAAQLQLKAYDLLDELVYSWTQSPIFALDTPVVLADVSVPVGFGSGLQALIENHFVSLVVSNPRTRVVVAHCPQCTSVVVRSGARGTVVARGVDEPEALSAAGLLSGSRHALFLDFEAEGSALVLRARMTALEPSLPIVYARTLSTSTSSAALLRHGERLKSAAEARQEYLEALEGRSNFLVPVRMGVRTYASSNDPNTPVRSVPFIWLQAGGELALTQARAWTASFSGGVSWMPNLHTAWMAQARMSRLLSGAVTSMTHPDLYAFVGGSLINVTGQSAHLFREQLPDINDLLNNLAGLAIEPTTTFAAFQLGLELRVKNRIGASVFYESVPALNSAPAIGRYWNLGPIPFHTFGAEVSFCF
jgi:hypothetical protein